MIKFEHQWGGEDTWYTKSKRWANKQKFPISHLVLGFIEWLYKHWVDGKVELEMDSVDRQAKQILKDWEKDDRTTTVEERPSSVPNLPTLIIRNDAVDRGSKESGTSMETPSTKNKIPDPWDYSGDWNDAQIGFYNESRNTSRNVEKR